MSIQVTTWGGTTHRVTADTTCIPPCRIHTLAAPTTTTGVTTPAVTTRGVCFSIMANRTPVATTTTANTSTAVATKRMTPIAAMMAGIGTIRIAVADVTKILADATQPARQCFPNKLKTKASSDDSQ